MRPLTTLASRLTRPIPTLRSPVCHQCLRLFSTTPAQEAGHNKWSKIKHRKGAADAQKVQMRTQHSKLISVYSRMYGLSSPQLANAVAAAKKAGVPKSTIEGAVARGQGRSLAGKNLESVTIEAIMPPGVALIIDVETESKMRSLEEVKAQIKRAKGRAGTGAMSFFTRVGRVVFAARPQAQDGQAPLSEEPAVTIDDVLDEAIEAGAEDLETDDEGNVVVWTQPNMTSAVTSALGPRFGGRVLGSEIIWKVNEGTEAKVSSPEEARVLADLLEALQEHPEVQAVYVNAINGGLSEEEWSRIEENIDT